MAKFVVVDITIENSACKRRYIGNDYRQACNVYFHTIGGRGPTDDATRAKYRAELRQIEPVFKKILGANLSSK